jgi:methyl-accepting chemotaxis protein
MLTSKAKIRTALLLVTLICMGTTLLSLSYMKGMVRKIEEIAFRNARIAELGEEISVNILEARREEKNFIIYADTAYILKNRIILKTIQDDVVRAREISPDYVQTLDSIDFLVVQYNAQLDLLVKTFQDDPLTLNRLQRQVLNYEEELKQLAKRRKLDLDALPAWTSDVNASLAAAATRLSADKARLFETLKQTASDILDVSQSIAEQARQQLRENSIKGISYGSKAQRNTITILLVGVFLLCFLIYYLPHRIFYPFRNITRALNALIRGETELVLPNLNSNDEFGTLSRSFREAVNKLILYNEMKSEKIIELNRNMHRLIEEIHEGVIFLSHDLTILSFNGAAARILNIKGELKGKSLKDSQELWNLFEDLLDNVEKKGRQEIQLKLKRRDIKKRPVLIIPEMAQNNKLENILIIIR